MKLSDFPLYSMDLELMNQKAKLESLDKDLVNEGIYVCVVYSNSGDDSEGYGTRHYMTTPVMQGNDVLRAIYFRGKEITENQFRFIDAVNFEYRQILNSFGKQVDRSNPMTWDDLIDCYREDFSSEFAKECAVEEYNERGFINAENSNAWRYEH